MGVLLLKLPSKESNRGTDMKLQYSGYFPFDGNKTTKKDHFFLDLCAGTLDLYIAL